MFSPFRTISSGTCPPEVNLPCTCRCLAPPPPPPPSRSTAAPSQRAIVLLNSICFLISLSHSFSVTRPEVGERADCAWMGYTFGPRRSKKSRQPSIFSRRVRGCLEAIRREVMALARPQRPTHQLVTRSYGSNAAHIHHRDISSNYADNLTVLSNDEPPAHQHLCTSTDIDHPYRCMLGNFVNY